MRILTDFHPGLHNTILLTKMGKRRREAVNGTGKSAILASVDQPQAKKLKSINGRNEGLQNSDNAKDLSEEQRRELRRRKQNEDKEQGQPAEDNTDRHVEVPQQVLAPEKQLVENGYPTANKLSKEGRRAAMKLKELTNHTGDTRAIAASSSVESRVLDGSEKDAVKAARKTEKARKKALKATAQESRVTNPQSMANLGRSIMNPEPASHTSTPSIGVSIYIEDPKLRALPQSEVEDFLTKNFISITDPTSLTRLRPIVDFSYLPKSFTNKPSPFAAFKSPTPIQSAAWPFLLSGRDVIGIAETGSGKTLAFGVPCIRHISAIDPSKLKKSRTSAKAVIVSPTRELAVQSFEQMKQLADSCGLAAVCVYGGVPKDAQREALKSAHIVVATPGRLNDLIEEGSADLSGVTYVVLDEADRMLDKGFEDEIRKIIITTSATGRQTLMFTATWPPSVRDLAATFMQSPVQITIGDNPSGELRANNRIIQKVEVVSPDQKQIRLLQLIKQHQGGKSGTNRMLIFCLYKKEATRVEGFLRSKGLSVAGIHGDMHQAARTASLEAFKSGEVKLLVATDVAARGLDIPSVICVINVTFPLTVEDYVHRIGRTGRAGKEGLAITLFTEQDKAQSGALINVLKAAGQPVPEDLLQFGTTVKKKGHEAYGAFYKEMDSTKTATKIKFDW